MTEPEKRTCCDSRINEYHRGDCPIGVAGTVSRSLADWWRETTMADMVAAVPKAIEYGSTDLEAMGVQLVALHPNVAAVGGRDRDGDRVLPTR
jgi:hypothetical protein